MQSQSRRSHTSRADPSHAMSFQIRTARCGRTWTAWCRASPSTLWLFGEMRGRLCPQGRASVVGTTDDSLAGQRCFVAPSSACFASAIVTGSGGVWSAFRHSNALASRRRFHAKWTVVANRRARRLATQAASRAHAIPPQGDNQRSWVGSWQPAACSEWLVQSLEWRSTMPGWVGPG